MAGTTSSVRTARSSPTVMRPTGGMLTGSVVEGSDPASAIFTTADGGGYWVASADGSVFTYGDAPYEGGER